MMFRVLITATGLKAINSLVQVMINGFVHTIRLMEDAFSDPFWKMNPTRMVRYEASSSDDASDSVIESDMAMSESEAATESSSSEEGCRGLIDSNLNGRVARGIRTGKGSADMIRKGKQIADVDVDGTLAINGALEVVGRNWSSYGKGQKKQIPTFVGPLDECSLKNADLGHMVGWGFNQPIHARPISCFERSCSKAAPKNYAICEASRGQNFKHFKFLEENAKGKNFWLSG